MNEVEKTEKMELYNQAKEAYYNGEQIMSDLEFDELETELGLENQGYIGSKSKHYTIHHPFIMGSISKVQVKFDENGEIDFNKYQQEIEKYLKKSKFFNRFDWGFEVTPKMDGCSFECVINYDGELISVSTRGDGQFGKDIKNWFLPEWEKNYKPKMKNWIHKLDEDSYMYLKNFVIRGEILVDKKVFEEKYSKDFTIPRSFVSGVINQDWEETPKQIEMRNDLSFITYDYREIYENETILEVDYDDTYPGVIISDRNKLTRNKLNNFKEIYLGYLDYRDNTCPFCLDGFVIKPYVNFRLQDNTRERQEDCVAVKFTPEIVETQIENIEWKLGKSGEYFPTAVVKEVILGGKKVNRVSLHNYDYIVRNQCGINSCVSISLAGDIIPFVIKINNQSNNLVKPDDSYIISDENSGCMHLMKKMDDEDIMFNKFLTSVKVLNIDGIGEKVATKLYNIVKKVPNVLEYMSNRNIVLIQETLGESKSTTNIINALIDKCKKLTLPEIIESCGFDNCGPKNALWLAKKISGLNVSNDGIPSTIIELFNSGDLSEIKEYVSRYNIPIIMEEKNNDKIPVIMTGDTSNTKYKTKKDWIQAHPQYVETTSWKECKILFTNDLSSTTSKMTKARKNGIEIRIYED